MTACKGIELTQFPVCRGKFRVYFNCPFKMRHGGSQTFTSYIYITYLHFSGGRLRIIVLCQIIIFYGIRTITSCNINVTCNKIDFRVFSIYFQCFPDMRESSSCIDFPVYQMGFGNFCKCKCILISRWIYPPQVFKGKKKTPCLCPHFLCSIIISKIGSYFCKSYIV